MNKNEEMYLSSCFTPEETTLQICCKKLQLIDKSADLTIDIPQEKIEQYNTIVINGIKFKKGE